jgi:hypothetical protein
MAWRGGAERREGKGGGREGDDSSRLRLSRMNRFINNRAHSNEQRDDPKEQQKQRKQKSFQFVESLERGGFVIFGGRIKSQLSFIQFPAIGLEIDKGRDDVAKS